MKHARRAAWCLWVALLGGLGSSASARAQTASADILEDEVKDLNWLGFQQFQEVSRVLVRTTEPVKYRIDRAQPQVIALVLENTRIPLANNRRFLDTRYFVSPITLIEPKVIEGPSPSVRIEIHVRHGEVELKELQHDTTLALDFSRSP